MQFLLCFVVLFWSHCLFFSHSSHATYPVTNSSKCKCWINSDHQNHSKILCLSLKSSQVSVNQMCQLWCLFSWPTTVKWSHLFWRSCFFLSVLFPWEQTPDGFCCMWSHPLWSHPFQHNVWPERNGITAYFVFVHEISVCAATDLYLPTNTFMWFAELLFLLAPKTVEILGGENEKPSAFLFLFLL